jgi:hypothetical protein
VGAREPAAGAGGYYTVERRPRLLGEREHRSRPARSAYLGGEVWLELCDADGGPLDRRLARLDVDVLASNRDLPLRLPLPPGEIHFTVEPAGPLAGARALGPPTRPRPSPAATEPEGGGVWGDVAWRLVGHLALNYHSLVDGPGDRGADALRGLLELYAAGAEPQLARHVEAVRHVSSRTVTGRLPGGGPITFGRGLEVAVELAEAAFQNGSAFVLGGVLEAFFRRHVALNSFVETVVRTSEARGGDAMAEPHRQPAPRLTADKLGVAEAAARPPEPADLRPLLVAPERFGLFAALRLIEAAHPDHPKLGEARRARDEPVRLGQPPHLHFPPAAIAAFATSVGGREGGASPRLLTYAFGLFGPQGARCRCTCPARPSAGRGTGRTRRSPTSATVLHHRFLALYWRAYAKARPAVEQDRPGVEPVPAPPRGGRRPARAGLLRPFAAARPVPLVRRRAARAADPAGRGDRPTRVALLRRASQGAGVRRRLARHPAAGAHAPGPARRLVPPGTGRRGRHAGLSPPPPLPARARAARVDGVPGLPAGRRLAGEARGDGPTRARARDGLGHPTRAAPGRGARDGPRRHGAPRLDELAAAAGAWPRRDADDVVLLGGGGG